MIREKFCSLENVLSKSIMKQIAVTLLCLTLVACGSPTDKKSVSPPDDNPRNLFNGHDLSGWHADVPDLDKDVLNMISVYIKKRSGFG